MKRIIFLCVALFLFVVAGALYLYSEIRDDLSKIVDYHPRLTTTIVDRNGELVGYVFDEQNRQYASFNEIPARAIEALVAIEDTSFFEHGGVNFEAIFRALAKDIKAMSLVEGASTLTQQLIKNMVLSREKSFLRKFKEAVLSFRIEELLDKEQIIERYLNQVYFGHGYYGIKTAAAGYFKKSLNELTLKEIAILVGLPKAPSSYDPTKRPELAFGRANGVLARMSALGWITDDEYKNSVAEIPQVYNETLTQNRAPYLVDEAVRQAKEQFSDIKTGGYTITLAADLRVQKIAEEALKAGYDEIVKRDDAADLDQLNGAMVVTNPKNGDILAMVGGVDYHKSSFNRTTQSVRQPGSSFKPFVYQAALDLGYSPQSRVADISRVFDDGSNNAWKPKNYGEDFKGFITLKEAITLSRNLATINVLNSVGIEEMRSIIASYGFAAVPANLSIALGSFGLNMVDYAGAYSMFAGLGEQSKSRLILKVQNGQNELNIEPQTRKVVAPEQAFLVIDMLKNVIENGTGRRAKVDGIELAGKTGTTNNSVDAWFVGFSPEIQAVIWYGNDNNTPMKKSEGGGRTAAPVFGDFMRKYLQIYPNSARSFERPQGVLRKFYKGKDEFYTKASPLPAPRRDAISQQERDGLIF